MPPVMTDPTGALVTEIRDELVAEGVTDRVRGGEPAPTSGSS
jgi:hypothetical protein